MHKWIIWIGVAVILVVALPCSFAPAQENAAGTTASSPLQEALQLEAEAGRHFQAGQYDDALPLYQRVLAIREAVLGKEHKDVGTSLYTVALVYQYQGNLEPVLPLLQRCQAIYEKAYGKDHQHVATAVQAIGQYYRFIGELDRAVPFFKRAIGIYETSLGDDHIHVATTINHLASVYEKQGDAGSAKPLYERTLAIYEKQLGPDHPWVAIALNNLANACQCQYDLDKAETLYTRAVTIYEKTLGADHPHTATALLNLANNHERKADFATARKLFDQALTIKEKTLGKNHPDVAKVLVFLGNLLRNQGEIKSAILQYERAKTIFEQSLGKDHPQVAFALNNMGIAYRDQAEFDRALPLHQRALALQEKALGKDHPDLATTLKNLGEYYHNKGDLVRAQPILERALAIKEKALGPQHPDVATSLSILAKVHKEKGDYNRALALAKRTLTLEEKAMGPDHPEVSKTLDLKAQIYLPLGASDQALVLFQRSLAIREKTLKKGHPLISVGLNNMGAVHAMLRNWDRAIHFYKRSLKIDERRHGKSHYSIATTINNLAQAYKDKGDYRRALPLQLRSIRIAEKALGKDHIDLAATWYNLGILRWAMGQPQKALPDFQRAMSIEHAHLERNLKRGTGREHLLLVKKFEGSLDIAITLLQALGHKNEEARNFGAKMVLLAKARATGASLRISRNARQQMALFDSIQKIQSQLSALNYRADSPPETIARLKVRLEKLQRRMAGVGQHSEADIKPSVSGLKRLLNENTALVEWVVYKPFNPKTNKGLERYGKPRMAAVVIRSGHVPQWFALGELDTLRPDLDRLRKAITKQQWDFKTAAQPLARRIFSPLEPALEGIDTLIMSPDGPLHRVPFASLVDEKGQWLSARFQLQEVTTARDLFDRRESTFEPRQPPLVLADPHFDRGGTTGTAPTGGIPASQRHVPRAAMASLKVRRLQGTKTEAETVQKLFGLSTERVRLGGNATEQALRSVKGPTLLHIATHGFFLSDQKDDDTDKTHAGDDAMLLSGLTLAGFNNRKDATHPDNDGLLTALELGGLDLYGTELVVLSACETGLGEVETGEGVFGLKRALSLAGARTQIVSLWKVDDKATQTLMTAYYGRLLRGEDRVEALRRVQLDMLHGRITESGDIVKDESDDVLIGWRNPYYWAGFVVSGAAGTIDLSQ